MMTCQVENRATLCRCHSKMELDYFSTVFIRKANSFVFTHHSQPPLPTRLQRKCLERDHITFFVSLRCRSAYTTSDSVVIKKKDRVCDHGGRFCVRKSDGDYIPLFRLFAQTTTLSPYRVVIFHSSTNDYTLYRQLFDCYILPSINDHHVYQHWYQRIWPYWPVSFVRLVTVVDRDNRYHSPLSCTDALMVTAPSLPPLIRNGTEIVIWPSWTMRK